MIKEDVDLPNALVWIPDSKTASGVAEVPLTDVAVEAFRKQISISGSGPYLFPNSDNPVGYQASFKKVWATTLRKAGVPYFRIYDLRSTYATRLSAGGVADEWVTQLLRQGHAEVFKKYSQDETADEVRGARETQSESKPQIEFWHRRSCVKGFWHSFGTVGAKSGEV
jgi:integrase